MKLLRNPWVTGALSLAALVVIYLQLFQGKSPSPSIGSERAPVVAAAPAAMQRPGDQPAPVVQPRSAEIVGTSIDRRYAQAHLKEWIDNPQRDPFLLLRQNSGTSSGESASPLAQLKLKAIWRQTGGRVAAINDRVYQEGDTIEGVKGLDGYRINKIEGDQVWFDGPRGPEPLKFSKPKSSHPPKVAPVNPAAAVPNSSNPASARS